MYSTFDDSRRTQEPPGYSSNTITVVLAPRTIDGIQRLPEGGGVQGVRTPLLFFYNPKPKKT